MLLTIPNKEEVWRLISFLQPHVSRDNVTISSTCHTQLLLKQLDVLRYVSDLINQLDVKHVEPCLELQITLPISVLFLTKQHRLSTWTVLPNERSTLVHVD